MSVPYKTVHFGRYFVDLSGSRCFGCPAAAFTRADAQSDLLHALLSNPYHYTPGEEHLIDLYSVHWSCKGALLWSMSVGMAFASVLHRDMDMLERMECAVGGFVTFDLWSLLSARLEAERNAPCGSFGMASETTQNIQAICLSVISLLLEKPEAL